MLPGFSFQTTNGFDVSSLLTTKDWLATGFKLYCSGGLIFFLSFLLLSRFLKLDKNDSTCKNYCGSFINFFPEPIGGFPTLEFEGEIFWMTLWLILCADEFFSDISNSSEISPSLANTIYAPFTAFFGEWRIWGISSSIGRDFLLIVWFTSDFFTVSFFISS